jgi:hypothetical protein
MWSRSLTTLPRSGLVQLSQIYTGWTFNSPWSENYFAFDISAKQDANQTQLFDGALDPNFDVYGSAQEAYDATVANGYFKKIRPAPPGRTTDPNAYVDSWTFTAPESLLFVVPDYYLPDNNGGVSVLITVVPESPAVPGDYNHNGIVDAADYTIWRDTLGSTTELRANGDNTGASAGKIDQADYDFWKSNFGNHSGSGSGTSATVPEPGSLLLLLSGTLAIWSRRGQKNRKLINV